MSLTYNAVAQRLLSADGFDCEPEPKWVDGEVPDFFCTGKAELWVEVKSLHQPNWLEAQATIFEWFRERSDTVCFSGRARAFISDETSQKDVKEALRLANRALEDVAKGADRYNQLFVVVPNDPQYGHLVKITIKKEGGKEVLYCSRSATGRYGRPFFPDRIEWKQVAIVDGDADQRREDQARNLGLLDDDFRVALALEPTQEPFQVVSAMPRGSAHWLGDIHTIRGQASKANRQFKNAFGYRPAPCLVMMFDDTLIGDDHSFLGAFYGDLQADWMSNGEADLPLHYGPNGFWNCNKNKTTSAACYVLRGGQPILVHNYWATKPLPIGLLGAIEFVPQENGTFKTI